MKYWVIQRGKSYLNGQGKPVRRPCNAITTTDESVAKEWAKQWNGKHVLVEL